MFPTVVSNGIEEGRNENQRKTMKPILLKDQRKESCRCCLYCCATEAKKRVLLYSPLFKTIPEIPFGESKLFCRFGLVVPVHAEGFEDQILFQLLDLLIECAG